MPHLSREQVRNIDRLAVESYGMNSLVLMENAGRSCAEMLLKLGVNGTVAILCGKGNNGGDGLVMARHLDARGVFVKVLLGLGEDNLSPDADANLQILRRSKITVRKPATAKPVTWLQQELAGADWVVDALLGIGLQGEPREPLGGMIRQFNQTSAKRLAIDIPSGLDCDTGEAAHNTVRAQHTFTFVAPKKGFEGDKTKRYTGTVQVASIGAPRMLVNKVLAAPRRKK